MVLRITFGESLGESSYSDNFSSDLACQNLFASLIESERASLDFLGALVVVFGFFSPQWPRMPAGAATDRETVLP